MNIDAGSAVAGAAISETIKLIVNGAWGAGKKWLKSYNRNQLPAAREVAVARVESFMNRFAERMAHMEEELGIHRAVMDRALAEPSFGSLLSLAMTHSANTEVQAKHELLSRLVASRLRCENESFEANLIPLACDALGCLTQNQLAALAYAVAFRLGEPAFTGRAAENAMIFQAECNIRAAELLAPTHGVTFTKADLEHLDAVGCGRLESMSLGGSDKPWRCGPHSLKRSEFDKLPCVAEMKSGFAGWIGLFSVTTVGECLGMRVLQQFGLHVKSPDWQSLSTESEK